MSEPIRLVQLRGAEGRRTALVEGDRLHLLGGPESIYALAQAAISFGVSLTDLVHRQATGERLDYEEVYQGRSRWKILPAVDHPEDPARCKVTGTGHTHLRSGAAAVESEPLTDSMKMYQSGVEGGRPTPGAVGAVPEWFYKGDGLVLRGHGAPLLMPSFAESGGEEAEIVGVYFINIAGEPYRIGMAVGDEFSDPHLGQRNFLYQGASKLSPCAIGPELVINPNFDKVDGTVTIERTGKVLWTSPVHTGAANMCHSLANLEHHHFKYPQHRRPGDLHVHFLGAGLCSFGAGVRLEDGDVIEIQFDGFGRPLRNTLQADQTPNKLITVPQI